MKNIVKIIIIIVSIICIAIISVVFLMNNKIGNYKRPDYN